MTRPTEDQVQRYIDNVLDIEHVFPSDNREHAVKAFFDTFFPNTEFDDDVTLRPGDQFCINQDGSAIITREGGSQEQFYPEDGQIVIKINI